MTAIEGNDILLSLIPSRFFVINASDKKRVELFLHEICDKQEINENLYEQAMYKALRD
jgi:hypothetical protein